MDIYEIIGAAIATLLVIIAFSAIVLSLAMRIKEILHKRNQPPNQIKTNENEIPKYHTLTPDPQTMQAVSISGKLILPDQKEILIDEKEKHFGRDDFKNYPEKIKYVSRNHFKILNENGNYYIEDIGSTGGTKLNGMEIRKLGKKLLNKGDKIILAGSLELIFLRTGEVTSQDTVS